MMVVSGRSTEQVHELAGFDLTRSCEDLEHVLNWRMTRPVTMQSAQRDEEVPGIDACPAGQPSGWASPNVISTWATDPDTIARFGRPSDASSLA